MYDTTPLKATLEESVDFDLINSGQVRLSLGAVDVRRGTGGWPPVLKTCAVPFPVGTRSGW